jgi:hypothetical protein
MPFLRHVFINVRIQNKKKKATGITFLRHVCNFILSSYRRLLLFGELIGLAMLVI